MAKRSIFDVYEPSELEQKHFTDQDNEIRTADLPERFQLRTIPVRPAEESELMEEAEWIYKYAFMTLPISMQEFPDKPEEGGGYGSMYSRKEPSTVGKIRDALNFMRNQHFEVPFIAFYRKEYVEPELNINDLWRIWQWDEKWTQLRNRKRNMTRLFEKMQTYQYEQVAANDPDAPLPENMRPLTQADLDRNEQSTASVRSHYADDTHDSVSIESSVAESGLAKKFGLTPEQFGENLRDNYQRHETDQYPAEPSDLSKEFINSQFTNEEKVLQGARHMVAMQLSREPLVRQCVRQTYFERAKVSTKPTKKGRKEVDEMHYGYTFKYLKNKPVKDLTGDQFLKMTIAEDEGLLKTHVTIDGETTQSYFDEIKQLYYRDEFSHLVQEWNTQRTMVLERMLKFILYPQMEKELRSKLVQEAKDGIIKSCCRKLYNWLKVAPYQPEQQIEEEDEYIEGMGSTKGLRVMGLAYSSDWDTASFAAVIDGEGDVVDFLRLAHLMKRRNAYREADREHKINDMEAIKRIILNKKPHVIVIGAENRDAQSVIDDVKLCVKELEEEEQLAPIAVELLDNELSRFIMNSPRAEMEHRDYPPLLRQALSLARRMQDPLIEFSQLCVNNDDLLCLRFHTLQEQVSREELLHALELEFINRVNEVGVDINRCVANTHTTTLAQFVCGLGPRKAAYILKVLKQNNARLENRNQLVMMCHMGPKVFMNCAGFIKIDTKSLGDSEQYIELLDGSRVHPETYDWARKMAVDALEYDESAEDANPAAALEEILETPERLKDLDLDAFAEELERQGFGNKSITLYDIRAELNSMYKDLRTPFRSPTVEEKFNMLTKETPETFYIGKLVQCRVTGIAHRRPQGDQLDQANPVRSEETGLWRCPFCQRDTFPELSEVWNHFDSSECPGQATGAVTRLDNGVSGFVPTKMISDKHVKSPEERVKPGMELYTRIIKIDIERFRVDLTCRSSDLADQNGDYRPARDLYYDHESEDKDRKADDEAKKKQARTTYVKRVIVHPCFHNISYKQAVKLMENQDQGDVIVRPSSKGPDHLTVTWKVDDGIYQHIDVREEGKENAFSLGQSLWINNEEFEDLDEIIARHIQPMASFVRDLTNHKYYQAAEGGKREAIEKIIRDEKKKAPSKIPYIISASKEYPGKFLLSYQPKTSPRHEFVTVTPDGFRFRQLIHHSVNALFRWFKEHFRDPIPGATPVTVRHRTPMAPSRPENTPAPSGINLQGVDPAQLSQLQKAISNFPSNLSTQQVFSALAAATGQGSSATPAQWGSQGYGQSQGQYHAGAGYSGAAGSSSYQTFATPNPMATPMMTPAYPSATPAQGQPQTTPRYQPTPQSSWGHGHGRTAAATASASTSGATPSRAAPRASTSAAAGTDWGKAALAWVQQQRNKQRGGDTPKVRTPGHHTPSHHTPSHRTPSHRTPTHRAPTMSPSPMVEGTPMIESTPISAMGDATPLIDEPQET
ncbi:Transcription elongation factor SPT6 [Branchiostoma belcheri]|nr:Transcription elongation factor SPT6 [Branchiostoma belcheri]